MLEHTSPMTYGLPASPRTWFKRIWIALADDLLVGTIEYCRKFQRFWVYCRLVRCIILEYHEHFRSKGPIQVQEPLTEEEGNVSGRFGAAGQNHHGVDKRDASQNSESANIRICRWIFAAQFLAHYRAHDNAHKASHYRNQSKEQWDSLKHAKKGL